LCGAHLQTDESFLHCATTVRVILEYIGELVSQVRLVKKKKDRRGAYLLFNLKNLTYEKPTFGRKGNAYFHIHQIFFAFSRKKISDALRIDC
jgi:hypothetical protein